MQTEVATALIASISALVGSAVGGFSAYFSNKSMRKLEWKLYEIEGEIASRRTIYAKFLAETNQLILQSVEKKANSAGPMQELFNIQSEIALISPIIGSKAKEIVSCVLDHHQRGNDQVGTYPVLRDAFIELCLQETQSLRDSV
jgi:hypothetical protein